MPERGGRHREARGHGETSRGQLAKAGRIPANGRSVAAAQGSERAREKGGDHHAPAQSRMVTKPRSPSTRTRCPVLIRLVAWPVPTTAGIPYSRATIAACDIVPPVLGTPPLILPETRPPLRAGTPPTRRPPTPA